MYEVVELAVQDLVDGRLFTHPQHIHYDHRVLSYMVRRLGQIITVNAGHDESTVLAPVQETESDLRQHRIILGQAWRLLADDLYKSWAVVGFFGQRRFDGDTVLVNERDQLLAQEMENHPGLISYSSLELTNGDYANCVLFVNEEAKNHWGSSQVHARVAHELSPFYYLSIRLYNGHLTGSLRQEATLQLTCAKYYDYSCQPAWRAVRWLI